MDRVKNFCQIREAAKAPAAKNQVCTGQPGKPGVLARATIRSKKACLPKGSRLFCALATQVSWQRAASLF